MYSRGQPEYYQKQVYNHGTRCWNGPECNVIVSLTHPFLTSSLSYLAMSFIFELLFINVHRTTNQQLLLKCVTENANLTLQELEKCEYKFTGPTPALCLPSREKKSGGSREKF